MFSSYFHLNMKLAVVSLLLMFTNKSCVLSTISNAFLSNELFQKHFGRYGIKEPLELPNGEILSTYSISRQEGGWSVVLITSNTISIAGEIKWQTKSNIIISPTAFDIGDGHLIKDNLSNNLYYIYRHHSIEQNTNVNCAFNIFKYTNPKGVYREGNVKVYRVEVRKSTDGGLSWSHFIAVDVDDSVQHNLRKGMNICANAGPYPGFWSPYLMQQTSGDLMTFYDSEPAPERTISLRNWMMHQWLQLKIYTIKGQQQGGEVTVSRASFILPSRDGMASCVEFGNNKIMCSLESVNIGNINHYAVGNNRFKFCGTGLLNLWWILGCKTSMFPGVIRMVHSDDGGQTWYGREEIYRPATKPNYNFIAPWITKLADSRLILVFKDDEDYGTPMYVPGGINFPGNRFNVKYIVSSDQGDSWSAPQLLRRNGAFPGVTELHHPQNKLNDRTTLLFQFWCRENDDPFVGCTIVANI